MDVYLMEELLRADELGAAVRYARELPRPTVLHLEEGEGYRNLELSHHMFFFCTDFESQKGCPVFGIITVR